MAVAHTTIVDDDGSKTTGSIWNNAWQLGFEANINAALAASDAAVRPVSTGGTGVATLAAHGLLIGNGTGAVAVSGAGTAGQVLTSNGASADPTFQGPVVQTTTSTGTVNDFALTVGCALLRANNASLLTLTGLTAGYDGQRLDLVAVGAGAVALSDQAAGSTAANRILTGVGGSIFLAASLGFVRLQYDATTARWRVLSAPGVGQLRCSAFNSTTQSVANATIVSLTLDSESDDVGGFHSTVTNTSRLTCPPGGDGTFLVVGETLFGSSGAGTVRQLYLALNGTTFDVVVFAPSTLGTRAQILGRAALAATDYLELQVYQDSGNPMNMGSGSASFVSRLTVFKVG